MEEKSDKRKMNRLLNAYEVFARDGHKTLSGKTRDVSVFGLGFYSDREVAPGAKVTLNLYIMEEALTYDLQGVVRHCTALEGKEAGKGKFVVGIEFTVTEDKVLPFLEVPGRNFSESITQTIVVDADIQTTYKYLSDISRFPDWVPDVKSAKVIERYPDGKCKKVAFEHVFLFLQVNYTDEYTYKDEDFRISFQKTGGDSTIVKNQGGYILKSMGKDKTAVTFHLNITISFVPAKRMVNYFATIGVRKALKNFKTFVGKDLQKI